MLDHQEDGDSEVFLTAFSCFSTCSLDSKTSMLRAFKLESELSIITALTGMLLGAYNGQYTFNASWRLTLQTEQKLQIDSLKPFFSAWLGSFNSMNTDLTVFWSYENFSTS